MAPSVRGATTQVADKILSLAGAFRNWWNLQFWIGVACMLGGTVLQNVGLGLQKLAHNRNQQRRGPEQNSYWANRDWWGGVTLFLSGLIMDFVALGLIPASVALPLGGLGLSVSGYFAHHYLGENFTKRDKWGTFLIVIGCGSTVILSSKQERTYSADELLVHLNPSRVSGLYVLFVTVFLCCLVYFHRRGYDNAVFASVVPGSIGAFGNLGGKGTAELVKTTVAGDNQLTHWFTYFFLFFTVAMLVLQNHYLQLAMQQYDQVIVVPVYYVVVCGFSVAGGVLFFGEWEEASYLQIFLLIFGVVLIFAGVYHLSRDHLSSDYRVIGARDALRSEIQGCIQHFQAGASDTGSEHDWHGRDEHDTISYGSSSPRSERPRSYSKGGGI